MVRDASPDVPTVLLVESAQDDRAMYSEYLRLHGFHPIEIADTGDGLALAVTADVIVTGIRVSEPFDGIELVRRLRADGRTKHKPVIILTACAWQSDPSEADGAGCDAFLPKPCLPDELVAEIRRVMAVRSVPRSRPVGAGGSRSRNKRRIA